MLEYEKRILNVIQKLKYETFINISWYFSVKRITMYTFNELLNVRINVVRR